ncbi:MULTISPECIES: hypothetical protein [Streptomyces]|uniref:Uncharacterized protein n=1 Tax=Streptomyces caniscabiei TaxID=2746961 RepID=A0ABU4MWV7_9ACTN|nr:MULTISPECIES: hypothetical protein [Streptomyces]MBE4741303.1 hypothetical protein [Streptomyces caniscabiei]MBE4760954.1 hypothetical protein [Streptomyces caniscabiei]MBE4774889.1 hypothetical protein [Streptomyces caniscabiei]MBE4789647.1 hypothetical protein [Streptomyces caniscabiei]MBE4798830.1 hypothetical protein [Streptomyces caniscabiei]
MISEIEKYSVGWTDLAEASTRNAELLKELALDKQSLRKMATEAWEYPTLRDMCEQTRQLSRIVLHDALDRGFRLRLHLWNDFETGYPHNHRWSFSTRLLSGGYHHTLYESPSGFDSSSRNDADGVELITRYRTLESAGAGYTLHHDTVHRTETTVDTVSLLIRGPVEKRRALTADPGTGKFRFSLGRTMETPPEVAARRMSSAQFEAMFARLEKLGIL